MVTKRIYFTKPNVAELLDFDYPTCGDNQVIAKVEYTAVSGGTERACIMGAPNTYTALVGFPTYQGYCGVGRIVEVGKDVKSVKVGDRALLYHGGHSTYNLVGESKVYKIDDEEIDSLDASLVIIAAMGLGGVRKLELELGESAMVIGLGLLGMFSVQFLRASGANPVIAVDFNEERRNLALQLGADYAFDPADEDFVEKVNEHMQKEHQLIMPAKGELSTELRILALIRMGISKRTKIAKVLNMSSATVYSYHCNLQKHSLHPDSSFDKIIANL